MPNIPVAEIFGPTIQGEGPNAGVKCIFVRLAGCDFKCEWCDSKFAWEVDESLYRSEAFLIDNLIGLCEIRNTKHVVFTGGNPCLYDLSFVIKILRGKGIKVDVETQGSILPIWLKNVDTMVISPKPPSSGQPDVFEYLEKYLRSTTTLKPKNIAIKIPVFNSQDVEYAKKYSKLINETRLRNDYKLYLSVGNDDTEQEGDISNRILEDYKYLIDVIVKSVDFPNVYILPQIHTLLYGNKQGV